MKTRAFFLPFIFVYITIIFSFSKLDGMENIRQNLITHVAFLSAQSPARNYANPASMEKAAVYIDLIFKEHSEHVQSQSFKVDDFEYRNIICSFGLEYEERIVIGAHYDVCGDQPGADDNASGVAGLLELARLLKENSPKLEYRIDLVAFALEEPPFFGTASMGSAVHAMSLAEAGVKLKVMICLEMIGYFSDKTNSQKFPLGFLKWFYPTVGNFISVVSNLRSHFIAKEIREILRQSSKIGVYQITAPRVLPGIGLSDHMNYWNQGYPAVMITDTAFYRNPHYHLDSDRPETLDFAKMAEVVNGIYYVIVKL